MVHATKCPSFCYYKWSPESTLKCDSYAADLEYKDAGFSIEFSKNFWNLVQTANFFSSAILKSAKKKPHSEEVVSDRWCLQQSRQLTAELLSEKSVNWVLDFETSSYFVKS